MADKSPWRQNACVCSNPCCICCCNLHLLLSSTTILFAAWWKPLFWVPWSGCGENQDCGWNVLCILKQTVKVRHRNRKLLFPGNKGYMIATVLKSLIWGAHHLWRMQMAFKDVGHTWAALCDHHLNPILTVNYPLQQKTKLNSPIMKLIGNGLDNIKLLRSGSKMSDTGSMDCKPVDPSTSICTCCDSPQVCFAVCCLMILLLWFSSRCWMKLSPWKLESCCVHGYKYVDNLLSLWVAKWHKNQLFASSKIPTLFDICENELSTVLKMN